MVYSFIQYNKQMIIIIIMYYNCLYVEFHHEMLILNNRLQMYYLREDFKLTYREIKLAKYETACER